jgi:hypothetical protein
MTKKPNARSSTALGRTDFAAEEMGNNRLHGNDQRNVRNERRAVPGVKTSTDGVIESFEKRDKDARAKSDHGKKR